MKLEVINASCGHLSHSLHIEDDRLEELCEEMNNIVRDAVKQKDTHPGVQVIMAEVATKCDNANELAFCMYQLGILAANNFRAPSRAEVFVIEENGHSNIPADHPLKEVLESIVRMRQPYQKAGVFKGKGGEA